MEIKRIGVLSVAKVFGVLYALLGLIFGVIVALLYGLVSVLGLAAGAEGSDVLVVLLFGIGAVLLYPIFLGIGGFIGGLIVAAIYNLVARMVGGIEFEVEERSHSRLR